MLAFLNKINTTHGSVEQCLIDLGLAKREDINQIKENMIVASSLETKTVN
jgi:hypothetical protein